MKPTRPELPREFVAAHKRRRIMDAMAELSAEQGYEATKIADIVRRAGVARKTLYDNFDGKEELFLAAFDSRRRRGRGGGSRRPAPSAGERVGGAHRSRPARLARLRRRAPGAGPHVHGRGALRHARASAARYEARCSASSSCCARTAPPTPACPETIEETLVGGVAWIVHQQIRRDEAEKALELLPELLRVRAFSVPRCRKTQATNREAKVTVRWQTPIVRWIDCPVAVTAFPLSSSRRISASG